MMTRVIYSVLGVIFLMLCLLGGFLFNLRKVRSYNFYEDHSLQHMHRTSDLESNMVAHSLNA
jgi:CHASE3 domain sensor protein